jgi:outer membrane immunogenic protein
MRRLCFALVTAASTITFAQIASAADLPTKAPVYKAPPPVWSWTGFYIGVNAGGSIGRDPTSVSRVPPSLTILSQTMSPAGFIGGGQLGYNYQFAPNWVVGLEGDFQGASQTDSFCTGACGGNTGITDSVNTQAVTGTQKLEWFATARARLGYTNGDWLWYVTGGGAWAQVHNNLVAQGSLVASANFNQSGWVVGGGVETHLGGGWTAKLEYLYMDLGSITDIATITIPLLTTFTQTSDIRDNIVRVGLNYNFNTTGTATSPIAFAQYASAANLPTKAPIYKAPPPLWSWTGFYIGVNAGGSIGRDPTSISETDEGVPLGIIKTGTMSPAGFIGGGQLGYNYQFAPNWVVGLEGDFQGASQKDSSCLNACGGSGGPSLTIDQKLEWFATARARFGYTNGDWLWYVTGGGAWALVHNDLVFSVALPGSANFNQSGWVVGGGVETHLAGRWTGKLEYLYMDLGSITDSTTSNLGAILTFTQTSDIRDHIVRIGLNYKFN